MKSSISIETSPLTKDEFIADLNGNGNLEVAIACKSGMFYIFDYMGNLDDSFDLEGYLMGSPAIGNSANYFGFYDKSVFIPTFDSDGKIYNYFWPDDNSGFNNWVATIYNIGKKIQQKEKV